jgi:Sugar kinases, ribokinase family
LRGYLWDEDLAKSSCKKATELAKKNNIQTALSLSDSFCVTKWHKEILDLTKNVDIVFGNEEEFKALFKTEILSDAISASRSQLKLSIITRGHNGSIVISDSQTDEVVAYPPDKLIDTTGAGDLYAAGFLYGLSKNMRHHECANLGSYLSSKVISVLGPRTEKDIRELAISKGLLS